MNAKIVDSFFGLRAKLTLIRSTGIRVLAVRVLILSLSIREQNMTGSIYFNRWLVAANNLEDWVSVFGRIELAIDNDALDTPVGKKEIKLFADRPHEPVRHCGHGDQDYGSLGVLGLQVV